MVVEIGRLCIKIAGRDAGKECLIIDKVKENFVLIDGNTRRRTCNIRHLEFLPQIAKIKKGASHDEVMKALADLGIKAKARSEYKKKEKSPKAQKTEKKKVFSLKKNKPEAKKEDAPKAEKKVAKK